jgi:hypothetical protein
MITPFALLWTLLGLATSGVALATGAAALLAVCAWRLSDREIMVLEPCGFAHGLRPASCCLAPPSRFLGRDSCFGLRYGGPWRRRRAIARGRAGEAEIDVAVVGAGIGGLTAAALLTDAGLKVLLPSTTCCPAASATPYFEPYIYGDYLWSAVPRYRRLFGERIVKIRGGIHHPKLECPSWSQLRKTADNGKSGWDTNRKWQPPSAASCK